MTKQPKNLASRYIQNTYLENRNLWLKICNFRADCRFKCCRNRRWHSSHNNLLLVQSAFRCARTFVFSKEPCQLVPLPCYNVPISPQINPYETNLDCFHVCSFQATVMFLKRSSNGEWKPNAFIFNFGRNACSNLRTNLPEFFSAMYSMDALANTPCVIPPVSFNPRACLRGRERGDKLWKPVANSPRLRNY